MNVLIIYLILGSRISKMQPKISYTCPGPVHMQKNCKMCAKYMLYIDLYVFGAKNFKNVTKTFIHLPRAHAHAKKLQKCVQNTCCISIYMFLGSSISKMQPKLSYTCPGPMHMQKKLQKCVQKTCCILIYMFWSQEFQKCNQKFC